MVIKVNVTEEQLKRAEGLYSFGSLKNSITKGGSNIYGALGEVIVHDYLESTDRVVQFDSTADFDMTVNGKTVDIKTKRTTVPPLPDFSCSIAAFNTRQKCDHYIFARVSEDKQTGWILGYMPKEEYFKRAKFRRKGQKDPKFPAFKFTADCYNLEISKLKSL